MKKGDIVIIVVLVIISFIPEIVIFAKEHNKYKSYDVEIYSQGKLYKKVPLNKQSEKTTVTVKNSLGTNVIEINKDHVKIIDADCKDKICVKTHSISKSGQSIICLPHKLVVKIKGKGKQETDDVSY